MCLIIRSAEPPTTQLTFYKAVIVKGNKLIPAYYSDRYVYEPGINIANGTHTSNFIVSVGAFHMHERRQDAEHTCNCWGCKSRPHRVIEVTAEPEDFIAFGYNDEAAYSKMTISQKEYSKALVLC